MKFEFEKSFFWILLFLLDINRFREFILIFIFLLIHELAHVLIGKLFGLQTERIICGLFGFRAKIINFDLLSEKRKFWILIAGPSINFLFWFLCEELLLRKINFFIGSINLLPIYPLDGGRIFILLLKKFFSNRYNKLFIKLNRIMILLMCIIGLLLKNLCWFLLAVYLFFLNRMLLDDLIFELYFK